MAGRESLRRVVLATGNAGKLRELQQLLRPRGIDVVAQSALGVLPPPEDGDSFVANALIKARHAATLTGLAAIADDSGLEVDALDGAPGVWSARFAGQDATDERNNALLLRRLVGVPESQRAARYRCAMVFVRGGDDPAPVVQEAVWEGSIASEPRGADGFGYDPLFIASGERRTAAEMRPEEKNLVSHRALALAALLAALEDPPSPS